MCCRVRACSQTTSNDGKGQRVCSLILVFSALEFYDVFVFSDAPLIFETAVHTNAARLAIYTLGS